MHKPSFEDEKSIDDISGWIKDRLAFRDETLPARPITELPQLVETGVGMAAAWEVLRDQVLPTGVPSDHPRYLAFVPGSPTVAAVLADMAISASGIYGGSTLDAGALITAERAALRWLADLVGMPAAAHGAFVSGGSIANLSALVAARRHVLERDGHTGRAGLILTGTGAHSSVDSAAAIMGCELRSAGDPKGRLDRESLARLLSEVDVADVIAVVATAGATNNGAIDDLTGIGELCRRHGLWLHVDAAYGGAALMSPRVRERFAGIEACDSITIDPHKWLFTPYDCGAVIYRDPELARRAHTQTASYLTVTEGGDNPADYAIHLSRRARGVSLWTSLLANGVAAYRDAVERCLELADYAAARIRDSEHLELVVEHSLSVVLLRRNGWQSQDYDAWSERALASGLGLITPTEYDGEPTLRLCFVNPQTTENDIDRIVADLH
jgi:L-2,4-diaminobutyrate decarboxylase